MFGLLARSLGNHTTCVWKRSIDRGSYEVPECASWVLPGPGQTLERGTEQAREKTLKWGGRDMCVFTRSTVDNLFIVAKVWYVLQVLCIARGAVQKFHRVFAVFLWGSTWKRTSRTDNICIFPRPEWLLFTNRSLSVFFEMRYRISLCHQVTWHTNGWEVISRR